VVAIAIASLSYVLHCSPEIKNDLFFCYLVERREEAFDIMLMKACAALALGGLVLVGIACTSVSIFTASTASTLLNTLLNTSLIMPVILLPPI
jgi:hypothetical protein